MATGTTSDFNLTRDELIALSLRDVGGLELGENVDAEQSADAIKKLNLIIRQLDIEGKHLWAIDPTPSEITLVANTFVYTSSNGLPTNILELAVASYRDGQASDHPLKILTLEGYEGIQEKIRTGEPKSIYLTEHLTLASKTMFVWPMLSSINTQSEVTGTDALNYQCIKGHTSDSTNKPITGANYLLYWNQAGSSGSAWATSTAYTAPQLLRLWFKRPLWDFDAAANNPDLPQGWTYFLQMRLNQVLAPSYGVAIEDKRWFRSEADREFERLFPSTRPTTTDHHDKVTYY